MLGARSQKKGKNNFNKIKEKVSEKKKKIWQKNPKKKIKGIQIAIKNLKPFF